MAAEASAAPDKALSLDSKPWPEPDWGARRLFSFAVAAALLWLEHEAIGRSLPWPVHACLAFGLFTVILAYIVGATGEVWVRISQVVGAAKAGVTINTQST